LNDGGNSFKILEANDSTDVNYTTEEIKVVIRKWYSLPDGFVQKMDIRSIIPLLGREWQDVFYLYANEYTLEEIADYWVNIHQGRYNVVDRYKGNTVVNHLCSRVLWLMSLHFRST
jgi:hypothetical protein